MSNWIPLYTRSGSVRASTLVDSADYEWLCKFRWHLLNGRYAVRTEQKAGKRRAVLMHREVLDLTADEATDHINRNGLDNRRSNLRKATQAENMQNRGAPSNGKSELRGVQFRRDGKHPWRARIAVGKRRFNLGSFMSESEAGAMAALARAWLMPFAGVEKPPKGGWDKGGRR